MPSCRMTHQETIILLLFVFAILPASHQAAYCSDYEVSKCVQPFEKYKDELDGGLFPDHDLQTMEQICRDWRKAESCLDDLLSSCSNLLKVTVQGLKDSYDFICSQEGLATYGEIHTCLGTASLASQGQDCSDTYTRKSAYTSSDTSALCRYTNEFLRCVDDAVRSVCGDKAADWQTTASKHELRPLLNYINCQLDGELSLGTIIGIAVGAALALVLIVTVVCCCCRKKKSRQSGTENRPAIPQPVQGSPAGWPGQGETNQAYAGWQGQAVPNQAYAGGPGQAVPNQAYAGGPGQAVPYQAYAGGPGQAVPYQAYPVAYKPPAAPEGPVQTMPPPYSQKY